MERGIPSLRAGLIKWPVWFLPERLLRTVWHGRRPDTEDFILVYGTPQEPVAVMTLFRGANWPDHDQIAQWDNALRRLGLDPARHTSFQDASWCDGSRFFRTRLAVAARGTEEAFTFSESSLDPASLQRQLDGLGHATEES